VEERSDARASRLLGEWLDRPRYDGADDPIDAGYAAGAHVLPDGGGAEHGCSEAETCGPQEEESCTPQGEEVPQTARTAAEGQGPPPQGEAEASAPASPLRQFDHTSRERPPSGNNRFVGALPRRVCWAVAALWWSTACTAPPAPRSDPPREIAAVLDHSAAAWNRGDLAAFMSDYARDSLTSFVAGGHVQYGWQQLYDHYQAGYFAPGRSRDSLSYGELRVRTLTTDLALCTARFALHRGEQVVASGPFTLIFVKHGDRWLIIHDHTSADPK